MAERLPFDLESGLLDLGRSLAYPSTPDIALAVRERLAGRVGGGRRASLTEGMVRIFGRPVRRSLLLAILLVLLTVGAVVAVGLGLRGLRIIFVETLPTPSATGSTPLAATPGSTAGASSSTLPGEPTPVPIPTPLGGDLQLGAPSSLGDVRALSSIRVLVPAAPGLGQPGVWIGRSAAGPLVSLVYRAGPDLPAPAGSGIGLLVMEFGGRLDEGLTTKMVGEGTSVEPVSVAGARGLWISGSPHDFLYLVGGDVQSVRSRLVGDTLVWERDGFLYRIESGLGLERTLAIAESMT